MRRGWLEGVEAANERTRRSEDKRIFILIYFYQCEFVN